MLIYMMEAQKKRAGGLEGVNQQNETGSYLEEVQEGV